jgi:hypothetical protein
VRFHIPFRRFAWALPFALAVGLLGFGPSTVASASETPSLQSALAQIPVKGRAPKTGYTRAQFGQTWADVDRNGCDTRNDILTRDLTSIVYRERTHECVVLSGVLRDPYSGTFINFVRGNITSMEVQIDHVVALSNAWQTGAFKLSIEQRTAFANDRLNLLAVQGRLNSQKGDGDAATWLPPLKSYRCSYVARQTAVKFKYGLWMTKAEKEAITKILSACPNQSWPSS